jgi:putative ABC transport system permease protein
MVVPESDTIEVGFPGVDFGTVTEQRYVNESDLWKIKTIYWRNNVLGFAPLLYSVVTVKNNEYQQEIVLAGTYFNKEVLILEPYSENDDTIFKTGIQTISPWWNVTGEWIKDSDDNTNSMIGRNVADALQLDVGDQFTVYYLTNQFNESRLNENNLTVLGIIDTQGYEDNQIFVNLQVAQNLTERYDKVHTIQVSALCNACPVDTFAAEIMDAIPYAEARTVKQLVSAEMNILNKIEDMMFLIAIIALFASALGVMTTMTTSVIERKKEIGLMKSIGAENQKIITLFLTEATLIGILGGISGYGIGIMLSQFIGISVFNTSITPHYEIIPIIFLIAIGVTLLASILPVRKAIQVEPAIVLRGE